MSNTELINFLREKLAQAEKSLRSREQMRDTLRTGTNASWDAAAKLHPDTAHMPPSRKKDRLRESGQQSRISERCRRDVEMYRAVIKTLDPEET